MNTFDFIEYRRNGKMNFFFIFFSKEVNVRDGRKKWNQLLKLNPYPIKGRGCELGWVLCKEGKLGSDMKIERDETVQGDEEKQSEQSGE